MGINKITIPQFLELRQTHLIIDVRSPAEFAHAHIQGAYNLPLFDNEERKVVGTAYKQQSREQAIKIGLDYFGVKMRGMVEQVEEWMKDRTDKNVVVHCWRGGMRSAAIAWLLDLYGFNTSQIVGGYKAYRKWVRQRFEQDYDFKIVGGYTGSGKTPILKQMQQQGAQFVDLEGLAKHKGSAFGSIQGVPQPSQEMFENLLAETLYQLKDNQATIWLEDESRRIGLINIPVPFWDRMRQAPVYFLEIPFEERLQHILQEYGTLDKDFLTAGITRIKKRLGGLETKTAIAHVAEDNIKDAFEILLKYYDKHYLKAMNKRDIDPDMITKIPCSSCDEQQNATTILKWKNKA